jgi:exopolysaccharide biosynthesis polyprenyl glycosylphosphotransferase
MRPYCAGLVVIDAVAAASAASLGFILRFGSTQPVPSRLTDALFAVLLPVLWVAVVALNRGYEGRFVGVGSAEYERVFRAFLHVVVLTAFVSYLTQAELARGVFLVALPLTLLFDLIGRYRARKFLHHRRAKGKAMSPVLAVGNVESIARLTASLQHDQYAGMRVVAGCVPSGSPRSADGDALLAELDVHIVGEVDSILDAVRDCGAHSVAVVSGEVAAEKLRWISWQLEGTDTDLIVSPGVSEIAGRRLHVQPVAGLSLLHVDEPEFTGFRRILKGAFDRIVASLALIVFSPVLLAVAVAVRLDSRGPALFRQTRIGVASQPFTLYKFRSMCVDAESQLASLQDRNANADGLLFKDKADPRVTRVGRFIRRFSLDELPQLINVVKGDMSLVGPRPPLPTEVAAYSDDTRRRLLVKPGITGLWQVSGRSDLSWDESVRLDLHYVENWSLTTDLMILWKTAFAVMHASGAY